ncbi:MAG: 16S rRNA (guanine(966)-N(2))-methyltransferase RsmD [Ruminococcaceae bacterium]|nr:16S rRNA (guanine(966)-N(2))-methyltransferase RsmD [Oscillospiraceae bacterium]
MRVITGSARGRKLRTLEGDSVRPTTDKVKESIFNIIQFDVEGAKVLDMFCGCGQLGIEALSRGAEFAVFTDISKASINVTEENLENTGFRSSAKTVLGNSLDYLDRTSERYDIAFLDPPYRAGLMEDAIERVRLHIADAGIIVCETAADEVLPEDIEGFTSKRYKYGKIALTVYRKVV